jgi:acetyl esterase/lipase
MSNATAADSASAAAPPREPLWPQGQHSDAAIQTFRAPDSAAPLGHVLVLPGGGYGHLAPHEGPAVAQFLNAHGYDASVLYYRLATQGHHHPKMIHDAQRAVRLLRARMRDGLIPAARLAVLGFSAGGHLASTLAVHYDHFTGSDDPLESDPTIPGGARPDAVVLCYAVIDMDGVASHGGSRQNLLGPDRGNDENLRRTLSNHLHVNTQTPPTFLWHTADDGGVPLANALQFTQACRDHQVPVELHVYESGRHGLGLARELPDVATWTDHLLGFLARHLRR